MKGAIRKIALFASTTLFFSACATYEPVEPKEKYPGKIVAKLKVVNPNLREELDRAESEYHASLFLFGIGSVLGGAVGGALVGGTTQNLGGVMVSGEPYRYTVETAESRKIVILNKHSGFSVGDCVAVLVGQETRQISMAYGTQCDGGS